MSLERDEWNLLVGEVPYLRQRVQGPQVRRVGIYDSEPFRFRELDGEEVMRTECMICDGCGIHKEVSHFDVHSAMMKSSDYLPENWVMVKMPDKHIMAYHSLHCAYMHIYSPDQGHDATYTQLAMFGEGGHEGE